MRMGASRLETEAAKKSCAAPLRGACSPFLRVMRRLTAFLVRLSGPLAVLDGRTYKLVALFYDKLVQVRWFQDPKGSNRAWQSGGNVSQPPHPTPLRHMQLEQGTSKILRQNLMF